MVKQLASLEENRDAMRAVAEQLEAPKTYSGNIALQQDAVNLSLRTIRLSPTTPAVYAETVDGRETVLERVSIREDAAIALDATRVPGFALADIDLTGRAVFQNRREQLEIFTANRNDLELAFGVDLIYLNAVKGNIVMVQYKMLDPISEDQNTDWIYYPDSDQQFQKEIGRMRNFSQTHPPGRLEYRINPQVFYLRFVRRDRELGRSTQTMPIDHFELLREDPKCQGPKEGYRITYDTLEGRYLHQQAFVDLVRAGYIGAHATKTAELETLIGTILREGRAAVGALQTSLPLGRDAIQEEEPPSTRISLQGSLFDL
ncbi:MAG: hypothetical protein OXF54_20895 [Caldilineaceae bacterium]|nr:hypothetical protein [Caldilineaceae bacterium]